MSSFIVTLTSNTIEKEISILFCPPLIIICKDERLMQIFKDKHLAN